MREELRQTHQDSTCPRRPIPCPYGCVATIEHRDQREHRATVCGTRTVRCRLECGFDMWLQDRDAHEQNHCDNRIVACKWGCEGYDLWQWQAVAVAVAVADLRTPAPARQCARLGSNTRGCLAFVWLSLSRCTAAGKPHHEAEECPNRPAPCPNKCAAARNGLVKAWELEDHLANSCDGRFVDCRLGCCIKVGVQRVRACLFGLAWIWLTFGGRAQVRPRDFETHETNACNKRWTLCRLGCGERLLGADVHTHERDNCPERLVECGLVR